MTDSEAVDMLAVRVGELEQSNQRLEARVRDLERASRTKKMLKPRRTLPRWPYPVGHPKYTPPKGSIDAELLPYRNGRHR
jgi:hypothetical protein